MDKNKRLFRSETDKVFAGICGGLGEYVEVDPVLIRLIWLLIVIFTGVVPGVLAYIFAIFIIPKKTTAASAPSSSNSEPVVPPTSTTAHAQAQPASPQPNIAAENAHTTPVTSI